MKRTTALILPSALRGATAACVGLALTLVGCTSRCCPTDMGPGQAPGGPPMAATGGPGQGADEGESATRTLLSVTDIKGDSEGTGGKLHVTVRPTDTKTFSCVLHFPVKTKDEVNFLKLTLKDAAGKEEPFVRKIQSDDDWAKVEEQLLSKDGFVWEVTPTLPGPYKEVRLWYKFAVLKGVDLIEGRSVNSDDETTPGTTAATSR